MAATNQIDKETISSNRFMYVIACFLQASSLVTSFLSRMGQQDSWLVVLISASFSFLLMLLYRELMLRMPDQNLIQMLQTVFGKVIGKVLGVLYILFFITLSSLNLFDMGSFTGLTIMTRMPVVALLIIAIVISSYAVRKGIKVITSYSLLFMIVSFAILILTYVPMVNQMDFGNFLPMLQLPFGKFAQAVHVTLNIPFGELVVILMITPNVQLQRKGSVKFIAIAILLGTISLLSVRVRDTAVLGNTMHMFALPPLVTLRLLRLGEALSRMEILFAIILIMTMFFKCSFMHYITVMAVAQFFNAKGYKQLVLSVGAFMIIWGMSQYKNPVIHTIAAGENVPMIWTFFQIFIPLLLFFGVLIKQKKQKNAKGSVAK